MNIRTRQTERVIVSEHSFLSLAQPRRYYNEMMLKKYYGKADAVVAVSEGIKHDLINTFGMDHKKMHTIYNFFDKESILKKSEEEEINLVDESFYKDKKLIVNIGRIVTVKNQKRLLYQFADLYKKDPDTRLLIIGSGPLQGELEETINDLLIQDSVRICSYCKNPFYLLKQASVLVCSSRNEGWGNVLLEAMSLGVPVVSVDCPSGPREIICDADGYAEPVTEWKAYERGILVTPDESEDYGETLHLSNAMQFCLENREYAERARQAGIEYIHNYSNEKLLKQWIDVAENTTICNELQEEKGGSCCSKNMVYGAGEYGRVIIKHLLRKNIKIFAVVVSEPEKNPAEILGVPVVGTDVLMKYNTAASVYLGVSDLYIDEVYKKIQECGISDENIITVKSIP